MYPQAEIEAGISQGLQVTTKTMTGVSWYPKTEPRVAFQSGEEVRISSREGALLTAIEQAGAGDTIVLSPGRYKVGKFLNIDKTLTFQGEGDVDLSFERSTLFQIESGGSLQLIGLNISGEASPDNAGNSVIRTSPYSMLQNYRLDIVDTNFIDMDVNHSFNIVSAAKGTFADDISITGSSFSDVTGAVLKLNREDDDYGIYSAEYLTIADSTFANIGGALVDYYRGGTDESTFGPHFSLTNSTLSNVGGDKRNKTKASIRLHGVQVTDISNNRFEGNQPFLIEHTVGEPKTSIANNVFLQTPSPIIVELNSGLAATARLTNNVGINP
jgi:poly(beta-D-mannuronate) lyase